MSLTPRFSTVDKAILVATGNSLVVCGSTTEPENNTSDLIRPDGTTTRDYTQAGSSANLNILENSTILYAELVWYSTVKSNETDPVDLRSFQDNPITFTTSKGSYQITPQYKESYEGSAVDRFRAADVTNYVKNAMSGTYTVSNVVTSIPESGLSNSRGGWTLVVIYRNNTFLPRKINYVSGIAVATQSIPLQTSISGFSTSSFPNYLKGNVFLASANGGPVGGQDSAYAGPSFASLSNIGNKVNSPNPNPGESPNNAGNNFFSGIINIANPIDSNNGLINVNGTNGTNNNDGFIPKQKIGSRNKWDITNVDISNTLVTNQTLLAGQITTTVSGDGLQLVAVGAQVCAVAPNMTATLTSYDIDNELNVEEGEEQVYSISIKNDGDMDANNVIISADIDSASSFIQGSMSINGTNQSTWDITQGINIGTVSAKGMVNIVFTVRVNSVPTVGLLNQSVDYSYQFTSGVDTITNYDKTNNIQIIVQSGALSIEQLSSKNNVLIGDTITYTVNIQNIGTELAKNILFQNKMDQVNCSFIDESVVINGKSYPEYNPISGFSLPNMAINDIKAISFDVKVNSLPASTKVNNVSSVSFGYVFNQYGYLREKTMFSNTTSNQVQYTNLIEERCNNNNYPKVGDKVTYTLSITNAGNINANNVQVTEDLIPGTEFIPNTVRINSKLVSGLNPFNEFELPDPVGPKQTTLVEYQVLVNEISLVDVVENIAQVPFKYKMSEGSTDINSSKISNKVGTKANYVCMDIFETVDKEYSTTDETLYYKVKITNTGNIDATDTVFLSSVQQETSFVAGSVTINGISYPEYNHNLGFTLGKICTGTETYVTYQAKVNSLPNPNIVYNQSHLVYSHKPDVAGSKLTSTEYSNTVQTIINKVSYTVIKSVDKMYAQVGDYLVYTTTITNTGTVPLTGILFADYIGTFLSFYQGSVYINGESYSNYNPRNQFSIEDLHPGDSATIVFGVTLIKNSEVGYIPNTSEVVLSYKQNPDTPIVTKTVYSNMVKTYDPYANISVVKNVDKLYSTVGDTLTYSFTITNKGNTNALNVIFSDEIQREASFVGGSVYIDGTHKPDFNPHQGFSLETLLVGQTKTVLFKVTVDSIPNPNVINNSANTSFSYYIDPNNQPVSKTTTSNLVTTVINSYTATLTKDVDKTYATIGDTLNYTVTAHNTGTVNLTNVSLKDIIPNGATFVDGSVIIDGVQKNAYNPNTGFTINDVLPGGNVVVMFKANVTSFISPPQIKNTASINFKYQMSPISPYIDGSLTSNLATTNIKRSVVTNTKTASKTYATLNDSITYTSVIENSGNVDIDNVSFIDIISSNASFVSGSVKIGPTKYTEYDPNEGFVLGTIAAGSSVTVTFDATVSTVPASGYITNNSSIAYKYKIDPNGEYISSNKTSNTTTTYINYGNMKVDKVANRTIVRLTDIITYNFVITNTGNTILKNLFFKDNIRLDSSFNLGTVIVNGESKENFNPNTGFNLSDIPIGGQTTISFDVTANSIPTDYKLLNDATVDYSYYVDPNQSQINSQKTSTLTTVYVYDTIMSANKSVDKSIAKIGDTLNFTIDITNSGSVPAQSVKFKDIVDSNLIFVENSVYIGNTKKEGYNPTTGFDLNDINPGDTLTVKFQATVEKRPSDNIVYNMATIDYKYMSTTLTSATISTNKTQTYVAFTELTLTKTVDKLYATVGDNLVYSVLVKNTGSVDALNLNFTDLMPDATSFNIGTVVVDGISKQSFNPEDGFTLTDLKPNEYHLVTFTIHIDSIPINGKVENTATVNYKYRLLPNEVLKDNTTTSNKVTTMINLGLLVATKSVDKTYATIGETLLYTIDIVNQGNATCSGVVFKDIIQSNATFVENSVKVNTNTKQGYNPNDGFNLDDIAGYGKVTVTFNVKVKDIPAIDYKLYNHSNINYNYYIDINNPAVATQATSNTVYTIINVASLTVTKSVSKMYATIDDILIYTIEIANKGNVNANNINFRDVLPTGLTFETGSVLIGGVPYSGYNPYSSFTLGNIIPGDNIKVKFNAKVTSVPNPSVVNNIANITFAYKINPSSTDLYSQVDSNTATTYINLGQLTITKNVDKGYATKGDKIKYTFVVKNTGNVDAVNVLFTDDLQSDVVFDQGSVKVGTESKSDFDPTQGFSIGTITPLSTVNIEFTATVIQQPTHDSVLNYAVGTFSYKIDPAAQYYNKSNQSNTVYTILIIPYMTATKTVDKSYATIQDTLNYSIVVGNTGNTTISQLFFSDTLSNGAIFKSGTVKIDNIGYPTYNPIDGFNLPTYLVAGNTSVVKFQATVNALPTPPQVTNYASSNGVYKVDPEGISYPIAVDSNTVSTNINVGSLSNSKTVDKKYARVGDTVTYTSTIINTGNIQATSLYFTDTLQSEVSYVAGTVRINNTLYPVLDPTTGFDLSDLAKGQQVVVTFDAKINSLPATSYVENMSKVRFSYKVDPSGTVSTTTQFSNIATTNVVLGKLNVLKTVDKPIATLGDTLTYTITLNNVGNVIANGVIFQDIPSSGVNFHTGSVKIGGTGYTSYDPIKGFDIGDIGIGAVVTVEFSVDVTSVPSTNKVINQAVVPFKYVIDPKESPYNDTSYSNTVTTNIAYGNLSVTKSVDKQYATIGEKLTYTITVVNTGNINASNVVFLDPTPHNSVFVLGSVKINGVLQSGYNPSIGFNLDTMVPGQIITVVYQVQVIDLC